MRGLRTLLGWAAISWLIALIDLHGQGQPSIAPIPLTPAGAPGTGNPSLLPGDPLAGPNAGVQDPLALGSEMGASASHGSFRVKVVGGRLVAHCEISTIHRRIPANLFIDLESPSGLQLHNRAAEALKAENAAGEAIPITLHFPEFSVEVERREAGDEEVFSEFTRLYSREIGEDAVVGALGAKFFKDYALTLDLPAGEITITPEEADPLAFEEAAPESEALPPGEDAVADMEDDGVVEVSLRTTDDLIWFPVVLPDGAISAMVLGTAEAYSLVDEVWCDELGHPAGDVSPVRLGEMDLAARVALRPAEINYVHEDGAFGVLGLNLLQQLRVEMDQARQRARIWVKGDPDNVSADLVFYEALIDDDPELYEAYLEDQEEGTHRQEAATRLLHAHIDEDADAEAFDQAVTWLAGTWREDIVSTRALDLMDELKEAGYPQAALKAGELGVVGGRKDRYPESVHKLHANMGGILLDRQDDKAAWRHLLSAAFGLPEDGMINLRLGECYERQGRYRRALSRYIQAVIDVDSGEEAVAALARVSKLMGDEDRLSVEQVERMIAGKTYGYTAATRYRPEAEGEDVGNRVALVEFFTNAHIKHPSRDEGAIGGALGNEGLLSYFPRQKVAMLAYHLPHQRLAMDSLTNEVAQARADVFGVGPTVQVVNGRRTVPGMGKARDAELIYKQGREVVREELKGSSSIDLTLKAELAEDGDTLKGQLLVRSLPSAEPVKGRLHLILAEKGVLYPGRSKVIVHRMVARAALTRSVMGEAFQPDDSGEMVVSFERSLREITQGNAFYLEQLQAEGMGAVQTYATAMDPRQLSVVAFLQDDESKEVRQAVQIDVEVAPDQT